MIKLKTQDFDYIIYFFAIISIATFHHSHQEQKITETLMREINQIKTVVFAFDLCIRYNIQCKLNRVKKDSQLFN